MKNERKTIIEVTDHAVKIFTGVSRRDNPAVSDIEIFLEENLSDSKIEQIFQSSSILKKKSSDQVIVTLPRRLFILRAFKLPASQSGEIKKMIDLRLPSMIPYGIDDVIYDFYITHRDQEGFSHIVLVIIHKDVTLKYMDWLTALKIKSINFQLSSFALVNWMGVLAREGKFKSNVPTVVMDIDMNSSELVFIHNNKVCFSRSLMFGARDLSPEMIIEYVNQVALTYSSYQKSMDGPTMDQLVVSSSMGEADALCQKLRKEVRLPVFPVIDPCVSLKKNKSISSQLESHRGISLCIGLGFMMGDANEMLNLIPKEVVSEQIVKRKKIALLKTIVLFFAFVVSILFLLNTEMSKRKNVLDSYAAQERITTAKVKEAGSHLKAIQEIEDTFEKRIIISEIMNELFSAIPEDLSIRTLILNKDRSLTVQGYAESSAGLNQFQENLIKLKNFKDVQRQFSTKRKIFNMEVTDFKFVSEIK